MNTPLAIKLRPKTIDDVIGQKHLVGENAPIRNFINNKRIFSMILYGNPGIGKTSIACAIAESINEKYRVLNATVNNKKDLEIVIEEAKMYDGIILIMDEIHRLNKDKQDILLPHIESGLIILIGLTTSNPYHKINPAIRSRCQLFELLPLNEDDIIQALHKVKEKNILPNLIIEDDAIKYIARVSGNDLRSSYNLLEVSYYSTSDGNVTIDVLKNINGKAKIYFDKNEDGYYDVISAFQKSIRGSDVNASLHYLARLIEADNLDIILRRLAVIVYEDIGLANPMMGPKVMAAISSAQMLGLPEARIPLAEIVIELALSPKSNSAEMAIDLALNEIRSKDVGSVPKHLHNGNPDYLYPHNYKNDYVKQQYLPDNIKNSTYYYPKPNKNEIILKDVMDKLSKM